MMEYEDNSKFANAQGEGPEPLANGSERPSAKSQVSFSLPQSIISDENHKSSRSLTPPSPADTDGLQLNNESEQSFKKIGEPCTIAVSPLEQWSARAAEARREDDALVSELTSENVSRASLPIKIRAKHKMINTTSRHRRMKMNLYSMHFINSIREHLMICPCGCMGHHFGRSCSFTGHCT